MSEARGYVFPASDVDLPQAAPASKLAEVNKAVGPMIYRLALGATPLLAACANRDLFVVAFVNKTGHRGCARQHDHAAGSHPRAGPGVGSRFA
jgi:hypothetical protein